MTRLEVAAILERYASKVIRIPGVSRTNPHAFAESKSELAGEMLAQARALRTEVKAPNDPSAIRPGVRIIRGRSIQVEARRKAA